MSTREALIRQNIEKARAKPEAPAPKETAGKQASGMFSGAFAGPRSFFGGNYEVYSRLESIDFRSGGGDGSLRGNTACIRLWKRGGQGLQSQDPVSASTVSVAFDLNDALAKEVALLGFDPNFKTSGLKYDTGFEFSDFNLPSEQTRWAFQTNLSSSITGRQTDLATKTPSTKDLAIQGQPLPFPRNIGAFNPGFPLFSQRPAPVFATPPGLLGPSSAYISSNPFGTVLSANPNGFVNILARAAFGTALGSAGFRPSFPSFITGFRYPRPLNISRANAMPLRESVLPRGEIMWQFLFNPSEMELEAGPEFKNAETWAVSDKANSGQPLHWAYNKNAQLKFNSILLNGYIFGRKVEELEQGLIELFMARDGDGQAGPHVLEFIWGKRKFGPCVIKNINVKEKMWDEGQVVNAELSFTLEQIPEWTINDGAYVDVARPGRQPLREDVAPNLQAGAAGDAGAGETPSDTPAVTSPKPAPGGGKSSNQKPSAQSNAPNVLAACRNIKADSDAAGRLANLLETRLGVEQSGRIARDTGRDVFRSTVVDNLQSYVNFLDKYRRNSFYFNLFNRIQRKECLNPEVDIVSTHSLQDRSLPKGNIQARKALDKTANLRLALCARVIQSEVMNEASKARNCNALLAAPNAGTSTSPARTLIQPTEPFRPSLGLPGI